VSAQREVLTALSASFYVQLNFSFQPSNISIEDWAFLFERPGR
jgi:hypothetical protein